MDATQQIEDSFFGEEDTDEFEQEEEKKKREPLATLKILKNDHIPETGEQSHSLASLAVTYIH